MKEYSIVDSENIKMRIESAHQNNIRRHELREKQRNGSIVISKADMERAKRGSVEIRVQPTARML
jgi:hypothetical protein